jgi:uroporphyrin-III C-methyltransferase
MKQRKRSGKVYLVGAGPGDPGLLTIKAYKVLKNCDCVIYDALLNSDILEIVPLEAVKISIGQPRTKSRLSQKDVERMMIEKALEGLKVVRLKGGDPFMFGRGGEEAEALTQAEIEWEIVPGVSSGIAAPAYAAIPLTHRECASSVTFITGHESINNLKIEWDKIRYVNNTLVVFMGVSNIKEIINQLLQSNYKPTTPIAIIESGTSKKQKVRTNTLGNILNVVSTDPVQTPALIVIGEVVKYRNTLKKYLSNNFLKNEEMINIFT